MLKPLPHHWRKPTRSKIVKCGPSVDHIRVIPRNSYVVTVKNTLIQILRTKITFIKH